jgi:hypothetical protein
MEITFVCFGFACISMYFNVAQCISIYLNTFSIAQMKDTISNIISHGLFSLHRPTIDRTDSLLMLLAGLQRK